MVISVRSFKKRFIRIFGDDVWNDFIDFGKSEQDTKSFTSMHDVIKQLNKYKKKIANRDLYTKGINRRFARFALISIERAFRPQSKSITFNKKVVLKNGNFNRIWEVEHIFSSKGTNCFDEIIKVPKKTNTCPKKGTYNNKLITQITCNSICNLTLISRELNGKEKYKNADFQTKKKIMNPPKYKEKDFYINRIFKNRSAKPSKDYFRLLLARQLNLKFDFNRIFKPDVTGIPVVFFEDVLGYSEGAIKSTPHITHLIRKWCRKRRRLK